MKTTELTPLLQFKPVKFKHVIDAHVIVYNLDRSGNTYHRVTIIDQSGNEIADSGKTYGYGSAYEQTAKQLILATIAIPAKFIKIGGDIKSNRYDKSAAFRFMREMLFLKVNYIVKG